MSDAPDFRVRACRDGPLLVVVEGINDVSFLKHLSRLMRQLEPSIPDLVHLEQTGSLIFLPIGGGNVLAWCHRLAPLDRPEFHLFDREFIPETVLRERAIEQVTSRGGCRGFLTRLPTAEHYLLPTLAELRGDRGWSPELLSGGLAHHIATTWYSSQDASINWPQVPIPRRQRYVQRAKSWLYRHVLPRMTLEHLSATKAQDEILGWFAAIAALLKH